MAQEPNPFKHVTFMDTNCAAKAGMVTVAGGAMGFLMALFMNAVEMRDMDYGRTKQSTRYVLRRDINKMFGMAKGFAIFGAFYSIFECQLEKLRIRDDATNSFLSCMFSSMVLAAESVGWKGLMMSGLGGDQVYESLIYFIIIIKKQFQFLKKNKEWQQEFQDIDDQVVLEKVELLHSEDEEQQVQQEQQLEQTKQNEGSEIDIVEEKKVINEQSNEKFKKIEWLDSDIEGIDEIDDEEEVIEEMLMKLIMIIKLFLYKHSKQVIKRLLISFHNMEQLCQLKFLEMKDLNLLREEHLLNIVQLVKLRVLLCLIQNQKDVLLE